MQKKIVMLLAMVLAISALFGGVWVAQKLWFKPPLTVEARVFNPKRTIKPFEFVDKQGAPVTNRIFNQHWSLLFLGYTQCPDVCPTTLAALTRSYKTLSEQGVDNLQVIFVSVDPQRDDSAKLKEYTEYFNPAFLAMTGQHAQLYPFVRDLGLLYSMSDDTSLPEYSVDHSSGIVLVDPNGQLYAMFKPEAALGSLPIIDMQRLESDFNQLIDHF